MCKLVARAFFMIYAHTNINWNGKFKTTTLYLKPQHPIQQHINI